MIRQSDGRLVTDTVDAESAVFLPERNSLTGKEIKVAVHRSAIDMQLAGKVSGSDSPRF
jgi:hypothetical protein